ncbi:hypothetical protein FJ444_08430 [Aestuariibacter sp. GS-14]|nr:hypothetical protein FJ444_08430 [Aestuariibacter sp. GS-14]
MFQISLTSAFFITAITVSWQAHSQVTYDHRIDAQIRYDNRSNRDDRVQYRLRYYPQITLSENWNLNSFVVTGDDFASSHNTFGESDSQELAVRRFYVTHSFEGGKVEFGVIPTYKGRVSSTGLSKDGWIQGVRYVTSLQPNHKIEFVTGNLSNTDPNKALSVQNDLNYFELEYSASLNEKHAFELGVERITAGNYIRGEWRYAQSGEQTWSIEYVRRVDEAQNKLVIGTETAFSVQGYSLDLHAFYAYVSEGFGFRAELTEDYLGTGHGGSVVISGNLNIGGLDWFSRVDVVGNTKRLLLGIKRKF